MACITRQVQYGFGIFGRFKKYFGGCTYFVNCIVRNINHHAMLYVRDVMLVGPLMNLMMELMTVMMMTMMKMTMMTIAIISIIFTPVIGAGTLLLPHMECFGRTALVPFPRAS